MATVYAARRKISSLERRNPRLAALLHMYRDKLGWAPQSRQAIDLQRWFAIGGEVEKAA
jgi:hypothetical protein